MGKKSRRRQQVERSSHLRKISERFSLQRHWHLGVAALSAVLIAVVAGLSFFPMVERAKVYPPTSIVGHIESYPEERISSKPIPIAVQKHILEHVPLSLGGQRRGVLLQYNCVKFSCEPDLVDRLAEIARKYEHVYMAPYPQMSAKIALTAYRRLLTLDELDPDKIIEFIEQR
jgi:hypothetical protein